MQQLRDDPSGQLVIDRVGNQNRAGVHQAAAQKLAATLGLFLLFALFLLVIIVIVEASCIRMGTGFERHVLFCKIFVTSHSPFPFISSSVVPSADPSILTVAT